VNDLAAKLALPARWLMVAGIAYTLATSVLYLVSPPATAPVSAPGGARPEPQQRSAVDLDAILASNLFGAADATAEAAPASTPAVATRLPLELLGVFVADAGEESAAIIAQRGRPGMLYTVGEDVPGNATLLEVHPTHVVLRRAGIRETLHFPTVGRSSGAGVGFEPVPAEPVYDQVSDAEYAASYADDDGYEDELGIDEELPESSGGAIDSVSELVAEYQEQIDEDPTGALAELGVEPVSEGSAAGYRIGDLARSPYLSQTGLQPGDVILSVNGRPVGDVQQDRLELQNVLAQGSARLEVQRGTRRFFVTASLQ
jgi:general secretion pathway protein C